MNSKEQNLTPELRDKFKAELKALEDAAFERGKAAGYDAGRENIEQAVSNARDEGMSEGAKFERERIQAVETTALPGHEALIAEMKFDGETTGPEAAQRVLAAEKAKQGRVLLKLKGDAPPPAPEAPAPANSAIADANLPVEERCKKQWDADPELRSEFLSYEGFVAFTRAEARGAVRIVTKTAQ